MQHLPCPKGSTSGKLCVFVAENALGLLPWHGNSLTKQRGIFMHCKSCSGISCVSWLLAKKLSVLPDSQRAGALQASACTGSSGWLARLSCSGRQPFAQHGRALSPECPATAQQGVSHLAVLQCKRAA